MTAKQTKHTPGPWIQDGRNINADHKWAAENASGFNRTRIAEVRMNTKAEKDEALSNARLIAAAPDLLVALEAAELSCTQAKLANGIGKKSKAEQIRFLLASFDLLAKEARAAIAKATGE